MVSLLIVSLHKTTILWNHRRVDHNRSAIRSAGLHFLIPPIIFHLYSNLVTYWNTYHAYRIRAGFH